MPIELREHSAQPDARRGLEPHVLAVECVAGVVEGGASELTREDLHGTRAKLDVVREEVLADVRAAREASQACVAADGAAKVQVVVRAGDREAERSYESQLRNRWPDSAEARGLAGGACE